MVIHRRANIHVHAAAGLVDFPGYDLNRHSKQGVAGEEAAGRCCAAGVHAGKPLCSNQVQTWRSNRLRCAACLHTHAYEQNASNLWRSSKERGGATAVDMLLSAALCASPLRQLGGCAETTVSKGEMQLGGWKPHLTLNGRNPSDRDSAEKLQCTTRDTKAKLSSKLTLPKVGSAGAPAPPCGAAAALPQSIRSSHHVV